MLEIIENTRVLERGKTLLVYRGCHSCHSVTVVTVSQFYLALLAVLAIQALLSFSNSIIHRIYRAL